MKAIIESQKNGVQIMDCQLYEGKIFFPIREANGFCSYDLTTKETEFITFLPPTYFDAWHHAVLYIDHCKVGDTVYLVPFHSGSFFSINLKDKKSNEKPINLKATKNKTGLFGVAVCFENHIYYVPRNAHCIADYDIDNDKMDYNDTWYKKAANSVDSFVEGNEFAGGTLNGCELGFFVVSTNKIVFFNLNDKKTNIAEVPSDDVYIKCMCCAKGNYYFLLEDGRIVKWERTEDKCDIVFDMNDPVKQFDTLVATEKDLWIIKEELTQIIRIDISSQTVEKIDTKEWFKDDEYIKSGTVKFFGEEMYILPNKGNVVVRYNYKSGEYVKERIILPEMVWDKYNQRMFEDRFDDFSEPVQESLDVDLGVFINGIIRAE